NEMKQRLLGVNIETLEHFSAVSPQTAAEMAAGIRSRTGADIGVSVTGNAGPQASEGKPVGMVFIGIDSPWHSVVTEMQLSGSREDIRCAAATEALKQIVLTARQKP
ncbi:MAG: CinA family protein, partial [Angelakisella sp.]